MIRAISSSSSQRCTRSAMLVRRSCGWIKHHHHRSPAATSSSSSTNNRSFSLLVSSSGGDGQLLQREKYLLSHPNYQHHHQQQNQQQNQQQRSLSTFQRLVDVVLQRPNPIVESIQQQQQQQHLDTPDTEISSSSLLPPCHIPHLNRIEPRHFQSAATQIQKEYDDIVQELEQYLLDNQNNIISYDSVIPILTNAEIPMTIMTHYVNMYYQLQKDPWTQQACAMASNILVFHHDQIATTTTTTTTNTIIPQALERIYKNELLQSDKNNHQERLMELEYWLQRYNISVNTTTNTNVVDQKDVDGQNNMASLQTATKELESKFITYMEEEEHNKAGGSSSSSKSSWSTRDKIQDIYRFLALKRQEAQWGGYEHHVDQVFQTQKSRIASGAQQVQELHDLIYKELLLRGDSDSSENDNIMDTNHQTSTTTKGADDNLENDMELNTYLTLDGVLGGLFGLSRALFGLNIKEEEQENVQAWHPEVRLFHVYDTIDDDTDQKSYVGSFYIDPYRRPLKSYRPLTGVLVEGSSSNLSSTTKPLVYMNLTIKPPVWDHMPTDVTLDDTVTLFHEFGHVLQLLFPSSQNNTKTTTSIPMDVEEVVPQFMEHWVYEESVLQSLAHLSQSTEPIPSELLAQISTRRSSPKKYELLERLFLAEMELALFSAKDDVSIVALQKQMAEKYMSHTQFAKSDISPLMDVMMHNVVTGKSIGHYRYVWGEVMSADLFDVFQQGDGLSNQDHIQTMGRQFRAAFLDAENNKKDFATRFHEFRGRDMSPQTMLDMYGLSKNRSHTNK